MSKPEASPPAEVVSSSGSPIYRHGEPTPWSAPQGEECLEDISTHVKAHLGPVESVFHEILSDTVHVDVHFVRPTETWPCIRLVTSGMSDLPMSTPDGADVPRHVELMMTLPQDWKLDEESLKDEHWYWPIRLLKTLARLPHKYATWLGWGHTVPNGDPPEPYADGVGFSGAIVLPSVSVPKDFHVLHIPGKKDISFYAVVPLFETEMNFKLRHGTDALLERLGKKDVSDVVDLSRSDVTKKFLGLW